MLRSTRLTLVETEYTNELQMVDDDGQLPECSADIFLERQEIAAAREAPPYDAEEQFQVVISEGRRAILSSDRFACGPKPSGHFSP